MGKLVARMFQVIKNYAAAMSTGSIRMFPFVCHVENEMEDKAKEGEQTAARSESAGNMDALREFWETMKLRLT